MRSLTILFSLAIIGCGTDSSQVLNEVKAGQHAGMRVTHVNDTLHFIGHPNSYTVDAFGDGAKEVEIRLIPYNVITCEDPKVLLLSTDMEFDNLIQGYYPRKDSIVSTPAWDASTGMYVSQVNTGWSCTDTVNGVAMDFKSWSLDHGHASSLSSMWSPLAQGEKNLLPESSSSPPISITKQDTVYRIWNMASPICGMNFQTMQEVYFMFKTTKGGEPFIGWIKVLKTHRTKDYVYVDSWAITEEPVQN